MCTAPFLVPEATTTEYIFDLLQHRSPGRHTAVAYCKLATLIDNEAKATGRGGGRSVSQRAVVLADDPQAAEPIYWYRKAVEVAPNYAKAHLNLGITLEETGGGGSGAAKRAFIASAKLGNPQAAYKIGTEYYPKGDRKYVQWITQAAALGLTDGIYVLGMVYEHGWGVGVDHALSVLLYRRAALQASNDALFALGNHYKRGTLGLDVDLNASFALVSLAAAKGFRDAQFNAGNAMLQGINGAPKKDVAAAQRYFQSATLQDHKKAKCMLGYCIAIRGGPGAARGRSILRQCSQDGDQVATHMLQNLY